MDRGGATHGCGQGGLVPHAPVVTGSPQPGRTAGGGASHCSVSRGAWGGGLGAGPGALSAGSTQASGHVTRRVTGDVTGDAWSRGTSCGAGRVPGSPQQVPLGGPRQPCAKLRLRFVPLFRDDTGGGVLDCVVSTSRGSRSARGPDVVPPRGPQRLPGPPPPARSPARGRPNRFCPAGSYSVGGARRRGRCAHLERVRCGAWTCGLLMAP